MRTIQTHKHARTRSPPRSRRRPSSRAREEEQEAALLAPQEEAAEEELISLPISTPPSLIVCGAACVWSMKGAAPSGRGCGGFREGACVGWGGRRK